MWPDCSPPTLKPLRAHRLEHVAVADLGAEQLEAAGPRGSVRGRGWTSRSRRSPPPSSTPRRAPGRAPISAISWSPSIDLALLVDHDQPVGVAVERDADIGAGSRPPSPAAASGSVEPQPSLMLRPLGETPIAITSAPSSHKRRGRDLIGGAVRAIDHDLEPVEPQMLGKGRLGGMDVAAARILDPPRAADHARPATSCGSLLEQRLDRQLVLVGELVAVGPEQFDAVVDERVVARRDHHAEVGAHRPGQHRHRRGRHRPDHHHVHADAGEAGDQRRSPSYSPTAACPCRSPPGGGGRRAGNAAPAAWPTRCAISAVIGISLVRPLNPVRAEEFARHAKPNPDFSLAVRGTAINKGPDSAINQEGRFF